MALPSSEKSIATDHVKCLPVQDMSPESDVAEFLCKDIIPSENDTVLDGSARKKLLRKIDLRLIPALAILHCLGLIDRANLPTARLAGMDKELGISIGSRYSILTMMFFVPYIILELPANLVMRKIGPAKWLGAIGFGWGVVTIGMGFCNNWQSLLACRIIFGALEAGLFPGCVYLLSCWYVRYEIQKRFSLFYVLAMLSSGFSSLLAYGLSQMSGLAGFKGWRWIFIIEGIASCLVAIIAFLMLVDFPDRAILPGLLTRRPFLSQVEARTIIARITKDRGDALPEKLTARKAFHALGDWKIWEFSVLLGANNTVVYSFAFFLPLILKGELGYSLEKTYLLLFPPSVFGVFWMLGTAYLGDKYHLRGPILVTNCCIAILGVSMMAWLTEPTARYIGAFLGFAVSQCNIPTIFSYQHNNIVGQVKRIIGTAVLVAFSSVGGIIAANVFRQKDAPDYLPGMITAIVCLVLMVALVTKNFFVFTWQNRRADRGEILIEGIEGFRYTL